MRRAGEKPEANDDDNSSNNNLPQHPSRSGTSSPRSTRQSNTASTRSFSSLLMMVVMTNPRRKVELFLLLAIPVFFFYVTNSYASSSNSDGVTAENNVVSKTKLYGHDEGAVQVGLLRSNPKSPSSIHQALTSKKDEDEEPSVTGTPDDPCTIWLAPSSLKGHPGYGLFTTRNISSGEAVLGGPDGLSIPVEDRWYQKPGELGEKKKKWIHLWNSYWWGRGVPDHVSFEASHSSADYQIGFGAMPNHHCLLRSLKHRYPETAPYQDSLVNRYKDPGAGAYSYSRGREFTVTRDVPAGGELFLNYGYCKHDRNVPSWTKNIFMTEDFNEAARLVSRQIRHPNDSILFSNSASSSSSSSGIVDNDKVKIPPHTDKLVTALLPQDRHEFEYIKTNVDANDISALAEFLAVYKGLNTKTVDDIRRDGMCMERMTPGHSTIPQAGQGGFAQFKIRKGEMIVPSPVLHIMDKDVLALYDAETGNRTGTQLLINYCFGHEESSVLMCPDTNALLINHCSTRMKEWQQYCPNGPNAVHRWASGWDATSDKWRQMSLDELDQQKERGLALEIMALRDIEPNEEITMDYGEEWERAWQQHAASWKPPPKQTNAETWISATDANAKPTAPIMGEFISHDLRRIKKHEYLFTGCQYRPGHEDLNMRYRIPAGGNVTQAETTERAPVDWFDLSDAEILAKYATDGSRFVYRGNGYSDHSDNSHYPCAILLPENNTNNDKTYTVRILSSPNKQEVQPWENADVPRILTNYSRDSIHYFVHPNQSDQHLPGVFRYPMGFRKDQFPEQWKNIKQKNLRRHFL